jgi:Ala-tRNA(Pro) deacylase
VATEDLTGALDEAGAAYELLPHTHTESASAEADALGLSPDDVAKTLIVKTREGYLRAVVPASGRLDEPQGARPHRRQQEGRPPRDRGRPSTRLPRLRSGGCAAGPRCSARDPVIVDSRVAARQSVVLEAGSHEQSVRIATSDLVRAAGAEVTDICKVDS